MPRRNIDEIREKIRLGKYDMTLHAMEEMAEDGLDIFDFRTVDSERSKSRELKRMTQEEQNTLSKGLRLRNRFALPVLAVLLMTAT